VCRRGLKKALCRLVPHALNETTLETFTTSQGCRYTQREDMLTPVLRNYGRDFGPEALRNQPSQGGGGEIPQQLSPTFYTTTQFPPTLDSIFTSHVTYRTVPDSTRLSCLESPPDLQATTNSNNRFDNPFRFSMF